MNTKFDPTKPCQTRDGRKVRILCTDAKRWHDGESIVALVDSDTESGTQSVMTYMSDGRYYSKFESPYDLINIPEKRKLTGWLNMYESGYGGVHKTRSEADKWYEERRIACLDLSKYNIEFEVGEGLEGER